MYQHGLMWLNNIYSAIRILVRPWFIESTLMLFPFGGRPTTLSTSLTPRLDALCDSTHARYRSSRGKGLRNFSPQLNESMPGALEPIF